MDLVGSGGVIAATSIILGSAAFFDRIASDPLKEQLTETLRGTKQHFDRNIPSVARFFITQTIGRLYPGDIVRWRNVLVSVGISIASITLFCLLIAYLNDISVWSL
jgi:hypothetical protein